MMTLIFNNDTVHTVNAEYISYNVMYQNQYQGRTESLSGTLMSDAISNLNYFEGVEIRSLQVKSTAEGAIDKHFNFSYPLLLDTMSAYQDAMSSGGISFTMSYHPKIEDTQL